MCVCEGGVRGRRGGSSTSPGAPTSQHARVSPSHLGGSRGARQKHSHTITIGAVVIAHSRRAVKYKSTEREGDVGVGGGSLGGAGERGRGQKIFQLPRKNNSVRRLLDVAERILIVGAGVNRGALNGWRAPAPTWRNSTAPATMSPSSSPSPTTNPGCRVSRLAGTRITHKVLTVYRTR